MLSTTDTLGRATVGLVAVLVVVATLTVGATVASTAPSDGPTAVSTADQVRQVEDNETETPSVTVDAPMLTRSGEYITYTTPTGDAFAVEGLSLSETDESGVMTVSANVSNPNDWLAVQYIEVRVDGTVHERTPVALEPGTADVVSFQVNTTEWASGDHHVAILSQEDGAVTTVTIEEPSEEPTNASVMVEDQVSDGTMVTVASVTVPEGGFVAVHESTSLAEGDAVGSTIGVSDYLEAGTHEDVEITLFDAPGVEFNRTALDVDTNVTAMAHLDSNENESFDFLLEDGAVDGPYTVDGESVVDDAMVSVEMGPPTNETTTEEPTTEEPANETTTEEPTTEEPANETTTEEPTTEEPANETTTEEPITEEPTTEEP